MKLIIFAVLFQTALYSQTIGTRQFLTGDWWGCRDSLRNSGISLGFNYTADVFTNLKGGLKHSTTYLDNFDLTLTLNLEKLLGVGRTAIFIYGLGNDGGNPDNDIGDVQGVSNITAPNSWKLYEAWIQTNLLNNRLSILAGLYDLNSEFESLRSSNLFINASHGIGIAFAQTGENGPSIFPWTSVGIRAKARLTENIYLQAVALDGVAGDPNDPYGTHIIFNHGDGLLLTFETGIDNTSNQGDEISAGNRRIGRFASPEFNSKYALGFWKYTSEFEHINSQVKSRNNIGAYFIGEQNICNQKDGKGNLTAFVRLETANQEINRFSYYAGCGLVYTSPLHSRPKDQAGIAFAAAINGKDYKHFLQENGTNVTEGEYNIEMTYNAQIFPWFYLQPDIQYIVFPDSNPDIPNSLAIAITAGVKL